MAEINIISGYSILPDSRVRFDISVINNGDSAISEVEVILDYNHSIFELEGSKVEGLVNIPPFIHRTVQFTLKPLGYVYKEEIGVTVSYRDDKCEKHTLEMNHAEIPYIYSYLKEKTITRTEFLKHFNEGYSAECGLTIANIQPEKVSEYINHSYKDKLYKVDEFQIENGKILYLAGESIGEEVYYLLTTATIEREGTVKVLVIAKSNKEFGISGFSNRVINNLRYLIKSSSAAIEIGIIKKEQVINIYDSVVQRTNLLPSEDENRKKEQEEELRTQQEEAQLKKAKETKYSLDEINKIFNEEFDRLPMGLITFNVDKIMKTGVSKKAKVNIANTQSLIDEQVKNYFLSREIKISPSMRVTLKGEKDDFDIQAITSEVQLITDSEVTTWEWNVKPLKSGVHTLFFNVYVIIEVPQYSTKEKSYPTLEEKIVVKVNPWYYIQCHSGVIIDKIGIIISIATLLVAILTFIYRK